MMTSKQVYKKRNKRQKGRTAGWVVLMFLCLTAAGIVWLRGTVDRDDRQMPEIPLTGREADTAAQPEQVTGETEPPGRENQTSGSEAAGSRDISVTGTDSSIQSYTQPAARTPAPAYQPPVYYPAQEPEAETEQEEPAPVSTPAPAAASATPAPSPVASQAPSPEPTPVQNSTPSGEVHITLGENELPLF